MKRVYWVFAIIAVAVLIRLLFIQNFGRYQMSGDSVSYYLTVSSMKQKHVIVDPWRTPVYPLIIAFTYYLDRTPMLTNLPREFSYDLWHLRVAQSVGAIFMFVLLFFLLLKMGVDDWFAGIFCIFMATNMVLMTNEHSILTEAFSSLWLIGVLYLTVLLLRRFTLWQFVFTSILFVVGVFLRPTYIAFPLLVVGILIWHHRKKFVIVCGVTTLVIYGIILLTYSELNFMAYSYQGISRISDVNMLGKILLYNLPVDSAPDTAGIKTMINVYRKTINIPDPWQVFTRNPQLYGVAYAEPFSAFMRTVILQNFGSYLIGATRELPGALVVQGDLVYNTLREGQFFKKLTLFDQSIRYIIFVEFFALPFIFYNAFQKQSVKTTGLLLMLLTSLYHIVFGVYVGYGEYSRHLSVSLPVTYFVCTVCLMYAVRYVGTRIIGAGRKR